MDKTILSRLDALEKANASKGDIAYVREVLRRVRVAAENCIPGGGIVTIELPGKSEFDE